MGALEARGTDAGGLANRRAPILHRRAASAWPAIAACVAASWSALAANPYSWTGRSWEDPPLGEVLSGADLVAEVKILVGGQFRADARIVRVFRASRGESRNAGDIVAIEGFNSYEWNTAYYAMREEEHAILALFRAGATHTLATPSSGRFPVDGRRVLARFGKQELLVEVPSDDFRAALEAYCSRDPVRAAAELAKLLERGPVETRYVAIELLGALSGAEGERVRALAPLAREPNPALREAAARALGRVGSPAAARALASFITDADRTVARAGALAACECGSGGAVRELAAWLERVSVEEDGKGRKPPSKEDLDAQVRAFQFLASGRWLAGVDTGEREAVVRAMTEMIASGRASRAKTAARVLGHIGAHEAVDDLVRLLDAQDTELREEAASALLAITLSPAAGSREAISAWWREHKGLPRRKWIEEAHALAAEALADRSYEGEMLARVLLGASRDPLGPWAARKALATGAGWAGSPLEEMGGPLVAAFAEPRLAEGSASARASAVRTLAELSRVLSLGSRGFAREFLIASFDPYTDVRSEALKALGSWGEPAAAGRLIEELERGSSATAKKAAADALRRLTGRSLGYYESKGYELEEESRGLERWREWWEEASRRERPAGEDATETSTVAPPAEGEPSGAPREAPSAERSDAQAVEVRVADTDPAVWLPAAAELVRLARAEPRRDPTFGTGGPRELESLARSGDGRLRAIAAALLGLRAEPSARATLEALLSDEANFVRAQAVWALGRCLAGSASAPAALFELAAETVRAPESGGRPPDAMPPSVLGPPVVELRRARGGAIQRLALIALGKIGGAEALSLLASAARSDDPDRARLAALALDLCPGEEAEAALLELLASASADIRELAARAVSRRRPKAAASALAAALERAGYSEGYALMDALARVARAEDARVLAGLLESGSETAALAAAYALSLEPGPEAAAALVKALEKGGSSVRYYAAKALSKLGRSGRIPREVRAAASRALAARLEDFDVAVASAAASALEHAGDESAAEAVFRYYRLFDPPDHRALGAAVRLGGRKGLELALSQVRDGTWGAKYFALAALRYSPTAEALKVLLDTWRDPESPYRDVAARSLVALGGRASGALAEILRTGTPFERRRAARLLGEIGGEEALGALRETAASGETELAAVAELALGAMRGVPPR